MSSVWKLYSCPGKDHRKNWECDDSVAKKVTEIVAAFY